MNETIINGIDVSECPLFDKKTGCFHTFDGECVKDSCTVYKWLLEHKRLQKENEKLKKLKCKFKEYCTCDTEKYRSALEEIREILMCKIYGLNENASQLDYMCYVLDKFEKIRIKILTKTNEVLNDRD